ncbi:heterogeneous nuclear ribonucleoprotein A1, A2/B1 homolog [Penaeus monodon]|uniref:heterogeneous nuclear ribonucleoprotein A1, A2/B1 homolog n=1 Tax=Penaeus monodon TaxID=6687 RepID=UPI0018A77346|nr:heterogeneous nuclear ribonucleoprotein A1, A2/B1 homolog [Penaeus monodon]
MAQRPDAPPERGGRGRGQPRGQGEAKAGAARGSGTGRADGETAGLDTEAEKAGATGGSWEGHGEKAPPRGARDGERSPPRTAQNPGRHKGSGGRGPGELIQNLQQRGGERFWGGPGQGRGDRWGNPKRPKVRWEKSGTEEGEAPPRGEQGFGFGEAFADPGDGARRALPGPSYPGPGKRREKPPKGGERRANATGEGHLDGGASETQGGP